MCSTPALPRRSVIIAGNSSHQRYFPLTVLMNVRTAADLISAAGDLIRKIASRWILSHASCENYLPHMANPDQAFVSVVTPFYNTEEYLAEAIESVLAQTHSNFEYILVNNCSTDGSVAIAESYLAREPRLRLLHNKD